MVDLNALYKQKYSILFRQEEEDGSLLLVKETADYRWFEYAGDHAQSIMNKSIREQVVTPVCQALLLFLLWKKEPLNILNLGLGGGSMERALVANKHFSLTAIEASQTVINIANDYFFLPKSVKVVCQQAEQFIVQTGAQYDVVLCDLFIGGKSPPFLYHESFYRQLKKITSKSAVLVFNLEVGSEQRLLCILLAIKKYFPCIAILDFDDYVNIIILCSSKKIPAKTTLKNRLTDFPAIASAPLIQAIDNIRYIN